MMRVFCAAALVLLCIFVTGCHGDVQKDEEGGVIMRAAIFPSGKGEAYLFEIKQDNTMLCSVGTRRNEDITSRRYYRSVDNQGEVQLSSEEVQKIISLADELRESAPLPDKVIATDSWDIVLSYHGEVYEADYWSNPPDIFKELVDEIIRLSAIPVNIHGWA